MLLLDAIKRYVFWRSLKAETILLKRNGEVKNYANSRFIGIWFDASNREQYTVIDAFARKLTAQGKKVDLLAYVGAVKKSEVIKFEHLEPKEISWAGVPNANAIENWADKPYDLLLCLHPTSCRPLEYLAMLSKATCRVGRYSEDTVECYDLMVSLGDSKDLEAMINQVDKILTQINKNQQQNAA